MSISSGDGSHMLVTYRGMSTNTLSQYLKLTMNYNLVFGNTLNV